MELSEVGSRNGSFDVSSKNLLEESSSSEWSVNGERVVEAKMYASSVYSLH